MPRIGNRLQKLDADIVYLQEVPPPPMFIMNIMSILGGALLVVLVIVGP